MRDTSCNISLNRRRDLTLREDLCFHTEDGKKTLGEIFKVKSLISFMYQAIDGSPDLKINKLRMRFQLVCRRLTIAKCSGNIV